MSDTRVIIPVDEQRVREIIREELSAERFAIALMDGMSEAMAEDFVARSADVRAHIRAGERPPFNRSSDQ